MNENGTRDFLGSRFLVSRSVPAGSISLLGVYIFAIISRLKSLHEWVTGPMRHHRRSVKIEGVPSMRTAMERASVTTMRKTRVGRGWAVVGGVVLLGMGMVASPANAQNASTGASVGGGATAPHIECAWALNDVNKTWNDVMQYGNDDTPGVGAGSPCLATTDGSDEATMPSPYTTVMIDVKPNAHDEPTQAYVELWGALDTNNANPSVYFDVYHPDGTQKVQIDAKKYASSATPEYCGGPQGMFANAQTTGQLTAGAVSNIITECQNQTKQLWFGAFGISKHQPWGKYRITMTAAAAGGGAEVQTFYIYVLPFSNLEKDFTSVNFGAVGPNSHYVTGTGNFTFDGANNSTNNKYSVRNTGNAGIALGVKFASMCLSTLQENAVSCTDAKRIDQFDARFGVGVAANLQSIGSVSLATSIPSLLVSTANPAPFGPEAQFDAALARTLCPNDVGKMEFSIWTENIQGGAYSAANGIKIIARPNPLCPTDLGAVYVANRGLPQFGDPATPISTSHWTAG